MKMTLLEMVQNILSALDADEINSITDTVEAQQVAEIIKETFYEQFTNIDIPEHKGPIKLQGLGDLTRPNFMRYGTEVRSIEWIKYRDAEDRFRDIRYVCPEDFFLETLQITDNIDNVQLVTDLSGVSFYIKTNRDPEYYTTLDDNLLIFNSYNSSVDSTLQGSKTFAWGIREQVWEADDGFIPPIDDNLFPLLLAESKSVCFFNLKQMASTKEEQRARRQRIRWQNDKYKDKRIRKAQNEGPDYSRKR